MILFLVGPMSHPNVHGQHTNNTTKQGLGSSFQHLLANADQKQMFCAIICKLMVEKKSSSSSFQITNFFSFRLFKDLCHKTCPHSDLRLRMFIIQIKIETEKVPVLINPAQGQPSQHKYTEPAFKSLYFAYKDSPGCA